ncbi:hypothetical protein PanWU01x14_317440 [Parasponia andersonii]|uniref:Uncharacterized protein n=1 Tax=Parasponia andersonii TaxID=3476 RepID=A0A2P5AMJ6_PARAD|nr:hypothetical protein PanWU01x14_317440 [Parasponia andersonii]
MSAYHHPRWLPVVLRDARKRWNMAPSRHSRNHKPRETIQALLSGYPDPNQAPMVDTYSKTPLVGKKSAHSKVDLPKQVNSSSNSPFGPPNDPKYYHKPQ